MCSSFCTAQVLFRWLSPGCTFYTSLCPFLCLWPPDGILKTFPSREVSASKLLCRTQLASLPALGFFPVHFPENSGTAFRRANLHDPVQVTYALGSASPIWWLGCKSGMRRCRCDTQDKARHVDGVFLACFESFQSSCRASRTSLKSLAWNPGPSSYDDPWFCLPKPQRT